MLAALALGLASAALETTWTKTAQVSMALCGLFIILATQDPGMRIDIARVWGDGVARTVRTLLLFVGDVLVLIALFWSARTLWRDRKRR